MVGLCPRDIIIMATKGEVIRHFPSFGIWTALQGKKVENEVNVFFIDDS